jgi:hypothetical protein
VFYEDILISNAYLLLLRRQLELFYYPADEMAGGEKKVAKGFWL